MRTQCHHGSGEITAAYTTVRNDSAAVRPLCLQLFVISTGITRSCWENTTRGGLTGMARRLACRLQLRIWSGACMRNSTGSGNLRVRFSATPFQQMTLSYPSFSSPDILNVSHSSLSVSLLHESLLAFQCIFITSLGHHRSSSSANLTTLHIGPPLPTSFLLLPLPPPPSHRCPPHHWSAPASAFGAPESAVARVTRLTSRVRRFSRAQVAVRWNSGRQSRRTRWP